MKEILVRPFRKYLVVLVFILAWSGLAQAELPDFTKLVEKSGPAVVNISTKQKSKLKKALPKQFKMPDLPEGSPFGDFSELFKHFFGEGFENLPDRESQSLGSGFVISDDGYILTNHHVVAGADEVQVRFNDRQFFEAKVIGSDKASDVALIKIDAKDLPTVKLGKSRELKVGEWVLAIGSPYGFDQTVTAGIVSAKGRSLPNENYVPFIQTDVAINPGNSGGPLFNLDGEVVGINAQIYSRSGGYMGLSFAIPIELAMNIADQIRTKGKVSRGYLGVLIQDVDGNLAESFGLDSPRGALVAKVVPDSPAEAAGLQPGDVILEYNGHRLLKSSQLPPLVGTSGISGRAELLVLRDKKQIKVPVRVGELPKDEEPAPKLEEASTPNSGQIDLLSIAVNDVSQDMREALGYKKKGGALITSVTDGPAAKAGLKVGDIIQLFDGEKVDSAKHLTDLVNQAKDKRAVATLVYRKDNPVFVALRLK